MALREVTDADLPALYEHQADPEAARMAVFPSRDRAAFLAHWQKVLADETLVARAVTLSGQVVGDIGSWRDGGRRLVGYWIGRHHWNQGIATWGLGAFLAEVTERPLYAHVAVSNPGSIRVLQKCGFQLIERVEPDVEEFVFELRGS